jgi:hypothetical protein
VPKWLTKKGEKPKMGNSSYIYLSRVCQLISDRRVELLPKKFFEKKGFSVILCPLFCPKVNGFGHPLVHPSGGWG